MTTKVWARTAVHATVLALTAGALVALGAGAASAAPPPKTTNGPCQYTETPDDPAVRKMHLPPDPRGHRSLPTRAVLRTNHGDIGLTLDPAKAPCTVQSFVHLIRHKFYDVTSCHRLTAYDRLKVLQCGDPSFTGSGGPGYRYRDELPTDLPPWPGDPTGERKLYARGVLAMANAGPNTNGSQFFLVIGDSGLRPFYTIFGTVDGAGLAALDHIYAGGIQPTPENPAPIDGRPALPVDIADASVRH